MKEQAQSLADLMMADPRVQAEVSGQQMREFERATRTTYTPEAYQKWVSAQKGNCGEPSPKSTEAPIKLWAPPGWDNL